VMEMVPDCTPLAMSCIEIEVLSWRYDPTMKTGMLSCFMDCGDMSLLMVSCSFPAQAIN